MKKIFTLIIFITSSIFAQQEYDFAIYNDGDVGAWEDSVVAFEHFLDWKGVSHNRVSAQDINTLILKDFYKGIFFPGGDADYFNADINSLGILHIQNLIADNGAYIGMCAGAEFACDKLVWQGVAYDYPLDLFQGEAVGPIDEIAVWPNNSMTTLSMNQSDEINQFEPETEDMLYWGGSVFNSYPNTSVDTIATFTAYLDKPAIIKFAYGSGRVLLISPHPEIEEDSDRDGTDVAEELVDNGSDWNFLWTATDWLLGNSLTEPTNLQVSSLFNNTTIKLYPNPTKNIIKIESPNNIDSVKIYNQLGNSVLVLDHVGENTFDVSFLKDGIYIVEIKKSDSILREEIIIVN